MNLGIFKYLNRIKKNHLIIFGMPAWDNTKPFHSLAIVAGIARESGFTVDVHDVNIEFYLHVDDHEKQYWKEEYNEIWPSQDFTDEMWEKHKDWLTGYIDNALSNRKPDLVGFSVNFAVRGFSIKAAEYIKSKFPAVPIMFGGVDCFPAEHCIKFLSENGGYCDIICQGEAELALSKYLERFAWTGSWRTRIPGFVYYRKGKLVNTGEPELPTLRERLPKPAYDAFDLSRYTLKGSLPFYLSRGCIYKCHFCSERSNFKHFRGRRAEEAFDELQYAISFAKEHNPVPTFSLADSNFNANFGELRKFVDLILKENLRINWSGQAHFDPKITTEFIADLARAGLKSVFWGFESASQHVIDLMNKRYKQTDARRIIDDCIKQGITQHLPIIIGFPGETPSDIAETIEFILEYIDEPFCKIHIPCQVLVRPNSTLYDKYEEFDLQNTHYYEWCTNDGSNHLKIRIARRFITRQAHSNPNLSMDGLVDTEEIKNIDLNEPSVAEDMFLIIKELFSRSGSIQSFEKTLMEWNGNNISGSNGDTSDLNVWLGLDKDSAEGRERLYSTILVALSAAKSKFKQDN